LFFKCDIPWCVQTISTVALLPVIEPCLPKISAYKLLYPARSATSCDTGNVWQHLLLHTSKQWTGKIITCPQGVSWHADRM